MKRHFKQLLVAFLALTMVLTGAMCVQAKTITKPAQTLTLYPSKSLHYNANRRIFATANETVVNTDSYMNWGTSSFKSSNKFSRRVLPPLQAVSGILIFLKIHHISDV